MSLALEQPRLAPVQPWGCPRARDNFGSVRPSPEKTACSFPCRFSGKSRNSGLVPGNRDPKFSKEIAAKCGENCPISGRRKSRRPPDVSSNLCPPKTFAI